MLRLTGAVGAAAFVGSRTNLLSLFRPAASAETFDCVAKPELTEGPYFVDERLNRSDIRSDPMRGVVKQGVPLALTFRVHRLDSGACTPLAGAYVDVWHADALGVYSDVGSEGTSGQKYLRGYQMTDEDGSAEFTTIFPGWYRGRTTHIHFKVRVFSGTEAAYDFTSQLFFDDAVTAQVAARSPYSQHGTPDTSNTRDGIYGQSGGQLTLTLAASGSGYAGTFDIGLVGVPATGGGGGTPQVDAAAVRRKKLIVTGANFGTGAVILLDGEGQATRNSASNPAAVLVAKQSGRKIGRGETVTLQVQNPDGTLSNEFAFTRPAS